MNSAVNTIFGKKDKSDLVNEHIFFFVVMYSLTDLNDTWKSVLVCEFYNIIDRIAWSCASYFTEKSQRMIMWKNSEREGRQFPIVLYNR